MCVPACCALHALWGTLYTAGGSIQMVAGIVFLLALPNFKFGSNVAAGVVNVLFGVVTIMISCLGNLNHRRCQKLLGISIIILTINVVNLVVLEIGEWYYFLTDNMKQMIQENTQMKELANYARMSTSITTAVMIMIAFIDSQLTFCSMEYLKKPKCRYTYTHETDIEYVIPRDKSGGSGSKNSSFHHCTQAWVFDAENGTPSETDSPYQKVPPSAPLGNDAGTRLDVRNQASEYCSRMLDSSEESRRESSICPSGTSRSEDRSYSSQYSSIRRNDREADRSRKLTPPTIKVQVNTTAEDGNEVDRQLNHMKTFYRTPSRGGLSHQSSFSSVPPIYECLERLTQPKVYMSRLDIYRSTNEDMSRSTSASSDYPKTIHSPEQGDNVHYAALVAELEKTLDKKKDSKTGSSVYINASGNANTEVANNESDVLGNGDRQRGSDAAFSKELEAALKLIQDLESPNTIDTPSETCTLIEDTVVMRGKSAEGNSNGTGSSKTMSGNSSPETHGKIHNALPVESQSTSGFNSLSHEGSQRITPTPEFCSDYVNGSKDSGLACIIRHMGETAVISLFSPTKEPHPYSNGSPMGVFRALPSEKTYVNKVNLENCDMKTLSMIELKSKNSEREEKTARSRLGKWKHFIDRKRRPSLLPEVESAIIKSECLAFLSDNELKDRLNQTKSIHRQIEAKVHRQRSFRRADSFGSVEDMLDRFNTTTRL